MKHKKVGYISYLPYSIGWASDIKKTIKEARSISIRRAKEKPYSTVQVCEAFFYLPPEGTGLHIHIVGKTLEEYRFNENGEEHELL